MNVAIALPGEKIIAAYEGKCVEHGWRPNFKGLMDFECEIEEGYRVAPTYNRRKSMTGIMLNKGLEKILYILKKCRVV